MTTLEKFITELEAAIPKQEIINWEVSHSSVGWHIEHTLLTLCIIIDAIKNSDPKEYKWTFSGKRFLLLLFKFIPRGKAKAPGVVQPRQYDTETLKTHIEKAKTKLKEINTLHPDNFFTHPYLGKLKLKPALKFLEIHTHHHLHIIHDILAKKH